MKTDKKVAKSEKNDKKRQAVETVVLRGMFYRDQVTTIIVALLVAIAINAFLILMIVNRMGYTPSPQYFPATNDYRLVELHPLSDPVVSNKQVMQFASLAAVRVFELDYRHWQKQLEQASENFTPGGWKMFLDQLKSSNNLKSLIDMKLVSTAEVTGAPELVKQGISHGRYIWQVRVPVQISYVGDKSINQTYMLTLIVVRMPVYDYPTGVAINNYIADARS